ncbi:heparinase II/III domain-containing protein [Microbacterium kyungheense]|uniref:Heparinase II/III-like protein n=1 Tax=Microbacterium kyungheense TaxID=1263636 RepID=A0A543EF29_9MICO|nr:heparinase II/III family protein [Microbacterium kyungheense]TQM20190.1 heparinase II/III-like protein [Microbacterium kyungheense]
MTATVPATRTFRGRLAETYERQAGTDAAGFATALAGVLAPPSRALPVASADDRSVWAPGGSADAVSIDGILERAEADLDQPWPVPLASAAARLHDDGNREGWESVLYERQRRLSRAAVAAAVHADDPVRGRRYLAEVLDGVWLFCEQSSWCWPAHDDAFRERGSVLPVVTAPYLDLGAGEVASLLAWVDQLIGDRLEARYPGIRSRVRHEMRVRIFEPFTRRRDWHWLGLDGDVHNWNPWIHGNVLVAALRLLDDPAEADERTAIVALALEGIDRYVSVLPEDGAIDEGYAYWWNGACRALEALDVVRHATGGVLDASGITALRETVAFPHRMHLGADWYLNLADGQARVSAAQPWHALHRAALAVGDRDAAAHAASHRTPGSPAAIEHPGFGRLLRGITDPAWIAASQESSPFPRDVWLPSTQVLLARSQRGTSRGLAVATKGGHNGEHHNHNDVGSFIVASDGVPVVVDAGRPTYTLQTFGPDRYDIWTMQSGWHNVPVIDGQEQPPGAEYAASGVEVHVGDDSVFSAELSGAYPAAGPWRRTVRLDRAAARVVVADDWTPARAESDPRVRTDEATRRGTDAADPRVSSDLRISGSDSAHPGRTEVRLLLAGEVRREEDAVVVTPLEGATPVRISWPAGVEAALLVRELDDPVLSSVWGAKLTRLDLDVTSRDGIAVTVELDQTNAEDA